MAESWKRARVRRVEGEAEVLRRSAARCVKQARRLTMVADGIRVAREARVEAWPWAIACAWKACVNRNLEGVLAGIQDRMQRG
eukprot:6993072-Alexandrium_andersonii.AAC.1